MRQCKANPGKENSNKARQGKAYFGKENPVKARQVEANSVKAKQG